MWSVRLLFCTHHRDRITHGNRRRRASASCLVLAATLLQRKHCLNLSLTVGRAGFVRLLARLLLISKIEMLRQVLRRLVAGFPGNFATGSLYFFCLWFLCFFLYRFWLGLCTEHSTIVLKVVSERIWPHSLLRLLHKGSSSG